MALIVAHAKTAVFKVGDALRRALLGVRSTFAAERKPVYRPEIHYMRGPGPRSREARDR
jgi:hypothetical protein